MGETHNISSNTFSLAGLNLPENVTASPTSRLGNTIKATLTLVHNEKEFKLVVSNEYEKDFKGDKSKDMVNTLNKVCQALQKDGKFVENFIVASRKQVQGQSNLLGDAKLATINNEINQSNRPVLKKIAETAKKAMTKAVEQLQTLVSIAKNAPSWFQTIEKIEVPETVPLLPEIGATPAENNASEGRMPTDQTRGETIRMEFKDGEKVFAAEEAKRIKTLPKLEKTLKAELAHLKEFVETQEDHEDIKTDIAYDRIAKIEQHLKDMENSPGEWLDTSAARQGYHALGDEARDRMFPTAANLRVQELQVANEEGDMVTKAAMVRGAVIADFGHTELSLQEMQDLQAIRNMNFDDFQTGKFEKLKSRYPAENFANAKNFQAFKNNIEKRMTISYGRTSIPDSELEKLIAARMIHTKTIALSTLAANLEAVKPLKGQEHLLMTRVSLLQANGKPQVKGGMLLDERVFALDQKAVFDGLEGSTIYFREGVEEPFLDIEGNIIMPKRLQGEGAEKQTLHTYLFNTSQSGDVNNVGVQKAINDDTLEKLKGDIKEHPEYFEGIDVDILTARIANLEAKLNTKKAFGEETVTLAEAAVEIGEILRYIAVNCWGGKDRTGDVCEATMAHHLEEASEAAGHEAEKTVELMGEWGAQMVSDENGCLKGVAKDNTGHDVIKTFALFNPNYLRGTTTQQVAGMANRIIAYTTQLKPLLMKISPFENTQEKSRTDKWRYTNASTAVSQPSSLVQMEVQSETA